MLIILITLFGKYPLWNITILVFLVFICRKFASQYFSSILSFLETSIGDSHRIAMSTREILNLGLFDNQQQTITRFTVKVHFILYYKS